MILKEVITKYPKSWVKLKEWCIEQFKEMRDQFLASIPVEQRDSIEIPEITEVNDLEMEGFIIMYTRRLYDFFDKQEIFISIQNQGSREEWVYDVGQGYSIEENTRVKAEALAFERAFEILEGKL